ncbi:hypothetical protein, partial [Enterococcus faecium]
MPAVGGSDPNEYHGDLLRVNALPKLLELLGLNEARRIDVGPHANDPSARKKVGLRDLSTSARTR